MKIEKVLLVNAPLDTYQNKKIAVNDTSFPPLGLLKIATHLKAKFPYMDIKIVDGDIYNIDYIKNTINKFIPDILGISVLTPCYNSALELANFAKENNVKFIVLGNDHASFFPELILKKRPYISYIIIGDEGHIDFVDLVYSLNENINPFEYVNNLYGLYNKNVIKSEVNKLNNKNNKQMRELIPEPDLLGSDVLIKYFENYNNKFGKFHENYVKQFTINNIKGCYKSSNRCLYCSIYDLKYSFNDADFFWDMIMYYHKNYNFNFFFEVCDNFGPAVRYRKELIKNRPKEFLNSDIHLMVYNDAYYITKDEDLLEDFKKLNVKRINLGLDSSDPFELNILKGFKNGDLNRKAIEKLNKFNIQVHCSFVFGALGESEESLKNSIEFIEEIIHYDNVIAVEVSSLFPLPNSPAWDIFLGIPNILKNQLVIEKYLSLAGLKKISETNYNEIRSIFFENDVIDLNLATKLWCNNFTKLNYDYIQEVINEINSKIVKSGKISGGFA